MYENNLRKLINARPTTKKFICLCPAAAVCCHCGLCHNLLATKLLHEWGNNIRTLDNQCSVTATSTVVYVTIFYPPLQHQR
jgi:hypothetical protein